MARSQRKPKMSRNTKRKYPKRSAKKTSTAIVRSGTPFADRFLTKLKYVDNVNYTGSGAPFGWYQHFQYRANSLFDCDYTSVSGPGRNAQPMGFDSLCGASYQNAPYLTYNVRECYIKCDFVNMVDTPVWVVIWPSRDAPGTPPASTTAAFEQSYAKYKLMAATTAQPKTTIYHKFSTAKMFGEKPSAVDTEDNFNGTYNTNPNNIWYWNVYLISVNASTTLNVQSRIELQFTSEFSDRNQLGQS